MRAVALSATKAGMTRLLDKGGASKDALYLLENGYINASQRATQRPGTVVETTSLAGTKGLCAYKGAFMVFSHQVTPMTDSRFTCQVLSNPDDATQPIKEIHFAEPFLGYPYVVAEFDNGEVFHYWLQPAEAWEADTGYCDGDVVQPTSANGLVYRATRIDSPNPVWAPDVVRTVGDVVEPTDANCFKYTVINTIGDSPKSGDTEPDWPTEEGATVYEDIDVGPPRPPSGSSGSGTPRLPRDIDDRYDGKRRSALGREVMK